MKITTEDLIELQEAHKILMSLPIMLVSIDDIKTGTTC